MKPYVVQGTNRRLKKRRQGDSYPNERFVTFKKEDKGGRCCYM